MRSRRLAPVPLLVRGLLALSRGIRRVGVSAFCGGRLGPGSTRRLLVVADTLTAWAARIALRAKAAIPVARNASEERRGRTDPAVSSGGGRSAMLVFMRTIPVGLLAATLWPGFRLAAVMAVVACAGLSAALRRQSPTDLRFTDWDVAVALCFGFVVSERILS
jgi:hypothetical protein